MSKTSNFRDYVLIVFFAAGLVALGAQDLHRRYYPKKSQLKRVRPTNLSGTLHGKETFERGSYSWKKQRRSSQTRSASGNGKVDELSRQDKMELGSLLDRISP